MIRTITRTAKAGFRDQAEADQLVAYLRAKGYLPGVRSMILGLFAAVDLTEPDHNQLTAILTPGPNLYRRSPYEALGNFFLTEHGVLVLNADDDVLQASAIQLSDREKFLEEFCHDVEQGIRERFDGRRVRGMDFDWEAQSTSRRQPYRRRYVNFAGFVDDVQEVDNADLSAVEPNYDAEDAKLAMILTGDETRELLLRLAKVDRIRSKDAADLAKTGTFQQLLPSGLVAEEFLLTCKQDQHTICVLPSKEHLNVEPTSRLRCGCGRLFPDENVQVVYTLTERGRNLISGSRWMSIWVTELLQQIGINRESIKWGLEASGEELDIMVEAFGSRIYFELKDREFGLGDSYPFAHRIDRYGGSVGVVATMDKVSSDAQKYFKDISQRRDYPVSIRFLERKSGIEEGLRALVDDRSRAQAKRVVQNLTYQLGIDVWPIIERWIEEKIRTDSEALVVTGERATAQD